VIYPCVMVSLLPAPPVDALLSFSADNRMSHMLRCH